MDGYLPIAPKGFALKAVVTIDSRTKLPPKDWPHAPVHRLSEHGIYFVTAGTLYKQHFFDSSAKLDLLERLLLRHSKKSNWQLEAWCVLANHYHFVARGVPDSVPMGQFLKKFHSISARELNSMDKVESRTVWYEFWDTRLTFQHSYLARLKYVHQNAAKHGLVTLGNQYRWCSAAWFERVASPAQVKTIYSMKIDRVKVEDDF